MELVQTDQERAKALGANLRNDTRASMRRRRGIFGLALAASASMSIVALYQLGILKHIPEPRLPGLASDQITASARAYSLLATPDAVLAIGSYVATMTLAAAGSPNRVTEQPALPLLMCAKTALDAIVATKYTLHEWREHRSLCSWCLLGSAAAFATVPLAIPEAREALQRLL